MMQYRKGKHIIEISVPYRRDKKALFVGEGKDVVQVATFRNNECAELFEKKLDYFLGLERRAE